MPIHPEKGRKMKKSNPREGVGKKIRGRLRGLMALMLAFVISIGMLPMQAVQAGNEDKYFIVNRDTNGKPVFFGKDLDSTGLSKAVVYNSNNEHLEYNNADKKWTIKSNKLEQRNIFNVNETTIIEIENDARLNFGTQWDGGGSGYVLVILDGENKGEGRSGNLALDTSITKGKYSVLYETYGTASTPCVKLTITTFSGYSVNLSGGANSTISGATEQTGLDGPMEEVTYTAKDGYHFVEFADITNNGITAKRTSDTVVTVSGTPTADASITVPDAVAKDKKDESKDNETTTVSGFYTGIKIKQSNKGIKVSWDKTEGVSKVDVFATYCGSDFPSKAVKSTSGTKVTIKKLKDKKIDFTKNFKLYLVAYDSNGKKIGKTVNAHFAGKDNKTYTNAKVISLSKNSVSVAKGQSTKVTAKVKYANSSKKKLSTGHAPKVRFRSTNREIATVDSKGNISGVKAGTCEVYAYAQNGLAKKVTVTVTE